MQNLKQAIIRTQQEFSVYLNSSTALNLQEPIYYQLKREFTTGTYRNDPYYTDRLITFLRNL